MLSLKGLLSNPGTSHKMSRFPDLQNCMAFVSAWTELFLEHKFIHTTAMFIMRSESV
jgi:hypothetical protein